MKSTHEFFEDLLGAMDMDPMGVVEQFDDRRFRFSVYLINQDTRAARIRKGAIEELVIEDDLLNWFHKGHIIFKNPDDVLERVESQSLTESPTEQRIDVAPYRFRGDARDMLYIYMEPSLSPDESTPNQEIDSPVHTMRFLFSIYAMEDIVSPKGKKYKQQKLYFHDYRMQLLREKTLFYSTAKSDMLGDTTKTQHSVSQKTNGDRSKPTGEIIQDILTQTLPAGDTIEKFAGQWEFGSQKMLYTSPSEHKALDDLNYVLDRHVSSGSSDNQPCILKIQRYTERWELLPVSSYFDRALNENKGPGPYQSEYFTLSFDSEADSTEIPPSSKTFGREETSPLINYHFPDISIIEDYTFNEINGTDCQEILNSVGVHRYNEGSKQFSLDVVTGNTANYRSDFQSLFINNTIGGDSGRGYTSWLTDNTRDQNLNISVTNSWSNNKTSSLSVGRNKKLTAALLLGNTIQFDVKGLTARKAGLWIAIDRPNNYIDSEYEGKVLGQYLVTHVTHIISPAGYTNKVIGVKPYLYQSTKFNTNDLFFKSPE
jgi:hypothetical protein